MPLESATYISDLNTSNPVGSTDKVQTLDDHIRLIKSAIKTTFPNVNDAVTASPAELNILDGATLSTAELNILDGVTLTAAQINDAARLSVQNTFTALTNVFSNSGGPILRLIDSDAGTNLQNWRIRSNSGELQIASENNSGTLVQTGFQVSKNASDGTFSQFTFTAIEVQFDLSGVFDLNGGLDCSGNLTLSGTLTTPGTSAAEVGYNGAPQNAQNGDYTLALTDRGKTIYKASGGAGETITIPANGAVAFPVGTIIRIVNNGGGTLTIAITTDTLTLAGTSSTGSRTLADNSVAVIEKVASTEWFISGVGLS